MYKRICFLYTETTGLHQTSEPVIKKKLFEFARMVTLNYEIGYLKDGSFYQEKKIRHIVKPRCMFIPKETEEFHGITQTHAEANGIDPEVILNNLKTDLKPVDVVVSHNVDFHLKTILAECVRYNISIDFSNFIIIDNINFYHAYGYAKLKDLATKLKIKNIPTDNSNNLELIKNIFLKLYVKFSKANQQN
jgi:DNA polymerase III epsilon subunit-like protein